MFLRRCVRRKNGTAHAALDVLLASKEVIEKRLPKRLGDLFDLEYDLLLHDVIASAQ